MDFLSKLKEIDFNNYNSEGVLCNGDWTLEYRYNMNKHINYIDSIQLIVVLKYNGAVAKTWGCMRDDQEDFVGYIMDANEKASEQQWLDEEERKRTAINMFAIID
jgi:hypothetical protein